MAQSRCSFLTIHANWLMTLWLLQQECFILMSLAWHEPQIHDHVHEIPVSTSAMEKLISWQPATSFCLTTSLRRFLKLQQLNLEQNAKSCGNTSVEEKSIWVYFVESHKPLNISIYLYFSLMKGIDFSWLHS